MKGKTVSEISSRLAGIVDGVRSQRGMTKKGFAALLGCSTPYLYAVLDGSGNPTIDTVAGWAERLELECELVFLGGAGGSASDDGGDARPAA